MIQLVTTVFLSCLITFGGCMSVRSTSRHSTAAKNAEESPKQQAVKPDESPDFLHSGLFDNNPKGLEAWLSFTKDGKCRVANASDFAFSEASKSELREMFGEMWYPRINHPAISGVISRRDWFFDLAVIIVDTSRSDANRFGLVVFNVPKEGGLPSTHWLFRDCDLSSALLSWYSNWPVLVFYKRDGTADPYYINWDDKKQQYFLDKEQKGPDARENSRLRDKGNP